MIGAIQNSTTANINADNCSQTSLLLYFQDPRIVGRKLLRVNFNAPFCFVMKVLLNHIKYPVVPKKVTIGKRLAQCLHPALPSGVHLKALDTYDIIFKCIGTPRLAHDLFVYSAGLFPLMGHAAMNVKPALLAVYEKHFTQLGKQVKPGLNGLLLGLLPGLEEGSEYYDR